MSSFFEHDSYLHLHGLAFETSIYSWQDQPGKPIFDRRCFFAFDRRRVTETRPLGVGLRSPRDASVARSATAARLLLGSTEVGRPIGRLPFRPVRAFSSWPRPIASLHRSSARIERRFLLGAASSVSIETLDTLTTATESARPSRSDAPRQPRATIQIASCPAAADAFVFAIRIANGRPLGLLRSSAAAPPMSIDRALASKESLCSGRRAAFRPRCSTLTNATKSARPSRSDITIFRMCIHIVVFRAHPACARARRRSLDAPLSGFLLDPSLFDRPRSQASATAHVFVRASATRRQRISKSFAAKTAEHAQGAGRRLPYRSTHNQRLLSSFFEGVLVR